MEIREARPGDNDELMALQEKCPQGEKLIVSAVNTPDFFARAKAYETYKIFVATDGGRIVGSAGIAIRNALINGHNARVGYWFQGFVDPDYRRKGVFGLIQQECEAYAVQHDAQVFYGLVMEDNEPIIRYLEQKGFELHRTLLVCGLAVFREMDECCKGIVRSANPDDLPAIAVLLNNTWQGYELVPPFSAELLKQFVRMTPAYDFANLLILQDRDEIVACLGYWNRSKIMRITVKKLSSKIRLIGALVSAAGIFMTMPNAFTPGDILKQVVLTPIGFKDPAHFSALLRHVNNQALKMGIEQIFCICERGHEMLKNMRGFIRVNTKYNLYVKTVQNQGLKTDKPVYINGIDL